MSTELRQRTSAEYLKILKRSKWQLALPTLAVTIAVGWVVWQLPSMYSSTSLLTIRNPVISEKVAPSLSDYNLSQRIQTISQNVLSRTTLEPLVTRFNLFESERTAGVPIEEILVRMRRNITVDFEKVEEQDNRVIGFRITYADRTPEKAQAVAEDLANKYIGVSRVEGDASATTTRQFIEKQLNEARGNLDVLDKQRMGIMTQNVDNLPESSQGLIAQLTGLRQREQTISKDKESLVVEKGRIQESIRALNSQARLLEDFNDKEAQEAVILASRVEDTPAYGQLIQRRAELSGRLENLKKQYRDKHPEIVQSQTDINKINDEIEKLSKNTDQRVKQANQTMARKSEMQKKSLLLEKEKAEGQIVQIDQQLRTREADAQQNSMLIAGVEAKINSIPNVKVALEGIENQYQSAKTVYDDLLKKHSTAEGQVERESQAQGEAIRIVDRANLPQAPANATKKPIFVAMGAAIGLVFGILLAAFYEVPRFFTIQNIEDAKHYTGLPVLASVPSLLTEAEISRNRRLHFGRVFAGTAAAVAVIPALILLLEATRVFEKLS